MLITLAIFAAVSAGVQKAEVQDKTAIAGPNMRFRGDGAEMRQMTYCNTARLALWKRNA